jgi:predicted membrane-bound mannosyltransferase
VSVDVARLRALLAATTPGPWVNSGQGGAVITTDPATIEKYVERYTYDEVDEAQLSRDDVLGWYGGRPVFESGDDGDRAFVVAAWEAMPELLDELERLRADAQTVAATTKVLTEHIEEAEAENTSLRELLRRLGWTEQPRGASGS